ncbi:MAG: glycosyltransferase family 2 protein, partial [Cyclobacteriaceae bacterium]
LTEDLDLSYRAQLKGWKFEYLEDIVSPAELPVIMPAIKSQQYRWNKGAAETAKKNVGRIWNAPIGKRQKTHALLHLLNNTGFIFILIASLLSVPMLLIKDANPELSLVFHAGSIFIIGFLAIAYFYWHATKKIQPDRTFRHWVVRFPMFLTFSMGLAFHNAMAVTEGYLGIKTPFIRTPKFNISGSNGSWSGNKYIKASLNFQTLIEGLISLYFVYGFYQGIALGDYGLIFFHLMLAIGFGGIFFFSIQSATYRAATAS